MTPINQAHAFQIQAGILGRKVGHKFEDELVAEINSIDILKEGFSPPNSHVLTGCPSRLLLNYILSSLNASDVKSISAVSTGALATSKNGKKWLEINGVTVRRCKSDIIIKIVRSDDNEEFYGVSTKQCNNKTPTNAQLYFTTASSFSRLLRKNGIAVDQKAETSLKQFCGDNGFRPLDNPDVLANRKTDPRRYFWEEIETEGRRIWEKLFVYHQDHITRLLLQKAYLDDLFTPDFLLHKTKKSSLWNKTEVAIYSIDELVKLSASYNGFNLREYSVRKGQFKDPTGIKHLAPRFGIVQMQRGGQAQHPTQLQFNLQAGYFYKINQERA